MPPFKDPGFQERATLARDAKLKALEKLRAKPPVDEAVLAERRAAAEAREAAEAEKRRLKREAEEQAKAERRAKAEAEAPQVDPDTWQTNDSDAIRATLTQVLQALSKVEQSISSVRQALAQVAARVQNAAPATTKSGMDQVAQAFVTTTKQPGYKSLLSLTSALAGISRERVLSLLSLRQ